MCWDLCVAIRTGDLEQVRRLLDNGSSVHEEEGFFLADAWRPLQFAHESVPMTRLLFDRGATLEPSDDEPRTAFHLASEEGHVDVVRFYLDRGTEVDLNGEDGSPLFFASKGGRQNVAQLLLDRGADVNMLCSLSLDYGRGTVDFDGGPLHVACYKGHFPMVQLLLEKAADPNSGGSFTSRTPLFWTCYSGSVEIARLLLESGAEMEDDILLSLCEAEIEEGRDENDFLDLLRFLLDQGADPDARADDDISTPLYNSCTNGHVGMARLLLDRGVDVDGDDKARPIHAACRECKEAVFRLLIDRGADVNAMEIRGEVDSDGQTPLHLALDWNYSKGGSRSRVVQLLLDHGADVNKATMTLKETALHFAWGIEQKEQEEGVFQMLLDRGAK